MSALSGKEVKESDLFLPIKRIFTEDGYQGDGEVAGIDLYLEKDGRSTAVELKKELDFRAIQQAALDQKTCDFVYIGIFRPKDLFSGRTQDKLYLLKRLGIGLICVSRRTGAAEILLDPVVSELSAFQVRHKGDTAAVRTEFKNRRVKNNTGGVNKTRLMTAYKEESLLILQALNSLGGQAGCRQVRELSGCAKSTDILYHNYHGWFENVSKGVYRISDKGFAALTEYAETLCRLLQTQNAD